MSIFVESFVRRWPKPGLVTGIRRDAATTMNRRKASSILLLAPGALACLSQLAHGQPQQRTGVKPADTGKALVNPAMGWAFHLSVDKTTSRFEINGLRALRSCPTEQRYAMLQG
jgi:hypothetical protein